MQVRDKYNYFRILNDFLDSRGKIDIKEVKSRQGYIYSFKNEKDWAAIGFDVYVNPGRVYNKSTNQKNILLNKINLQLEQVKNKGISNNSIIS